MTRHVVIIELSTEHLKTVLEQCSTVLSERLREKVNVYMVFIRFSCIKNILCRPHPLSESWDADFC